MLVVRPAVGAQFGAGLAGVNWKSIRVQVGGLCIQESPARESVAPALNASTIGSWMASEAYRTAHLFSVFPPAEDAVKPDLALSRFLWQKPGNHQYAASDAIALANYDCPNIVYLSFENAPHYSTDGTDLTMAKGVDLRAIGELRLELEYALGGTAPQVVDVLLCHDEVYAVDRSGAVNITQYVF